MPSKKKAAGLGCGVVLIICAAVLTTVTEAVLRAAVTGMVRPPRGNRAGPAPVPRRSRDGPATVPRPQKPRRSSSTTRSRPRRSTVAERNSARRSSFGLILAALDCEPRPRFNAGKASTRIRRYGKVEVAYDAHLWNITNLLAVLEDGAKPALQEVKVELTDRQSNWDFKVKGNSFTHDAAERRSCPLVLTLPCPSRGRHTHSNAAGTNKNGARTAEIRSVQVQELVDVRDAQRRGGAPT